MQWIFSWLLAFLLASNLFGSCVASEIIYAPFVGQNAGGGTIAGRVLATDNSVLPGAEISAVRLEDGKVTKTPTDENGAFSITALLPGIYAISAESTGFKKAIHDSIRVVDGERVVVDFQMKMPPADHVDYVLESLTLDQIVAKSDAVVFLRIDHIGAMNEWEMGGKDSVLGAPIQVRMIEAIKTHPTYGPFHADFEFLHLGSIVPYTVGRQYVAFLTWNAHDKQFLPMAGDNYMIEIIKGRVATTTSDPKGANILKGVKVGISIAELLARLRSAVK